MIPVNIFRNLSAHVFLPLIRKSYPSFSSAAQTSNIVLALLLTISRPFHPAVDFWNPPDHLCIAPLLFFILPTFRSFPAPAGRMRFMCIVLSREGSLSRRMLDFSDPRAAKPIMFGACRTSRFAILSCHSHPCNRSRTWSIFGASQHVSFCSPRIFIYFLHQSAYLHRGRVLLGGREQRPGRSFSVIYIMHELRLRVFPPVWSVLHVISSKRDRFN